MVFLSIVTPTSVEPVHVCKLNKDMLKLEDRLEISMGCGKINGIRVYSTEKLEKLYDKAVIKVINEKKEATIWRRMS